MGRNFDHVYLVSSSYNPIPTFLTDGLRAFFFGGGGGVRIRDFFNPELEFVADSVSGFVSCLRLLILDYKQYLQVIETNVTCQYFWLRYKVHYDVLSLKMFLKKITCSRELKFESTKKSVLYCIYIQNHLNRSPILRDCAFKGL